MSKSRVSDRLLIILCTVLLAGAAGIWWRNRQAVSPATPPISRSVGEVVSQSSENRNRNAKTDAFGRRFPTSEKQTDSPKHTTTSERLSEAIVLAARYLYRACRPNGQFVYRINLDPNVIPSEKYNMLRHAGAMYALGKYYGWRPDVEARDALVRAGRFLKEQSLGPIPERDDLLAIWSRTEITRGTGPLQVKLGGAGLGLVALMSLESVTPGATHLEDLRKLGRFLVYLQKPDGSFYSKYIPSTGGRNDQWVSLYYPGEAILGLIMLYERDPSPEWLTAAANGLAYLARSREGLTRLPLDHWALIATAQFLPLAKPSDATSFRHILVEHAAKVCESMIVGHADDNRAMTDPPVYSSDGRTTPLATRLEGMQAVWDLLPSENAALTDRVHRYVHGGIHWLVDTQIRSGQFAGAVPRANQRLPNDGTDKTRAFNERATEVRIDYVQHALCAWIKYVQMLEPER